MKNIAFPQQGSNFESVTCKFSKNCTTSQVFFKEFLHRHRTAILKNVSWSLLLKGSCKHIFNLEILADTYFLLWCHVKEELIFMIFLSKDFGIKCKHSELALDLVQKQYFS